MCFGGEIHLKPAGGGGLVAGEHFGFGVAVLDGVRQAAKRFDQLLVGVVGGFERNLPDELPAVSEVQQRGAHPAHECGEPQDEGGGPIRNPAGIDRNLDIQRGSPAFDKRESRLGAAAATEIDTHSVRMIHHAPSVALRGCDQFPVKRGTGRRQANRWLDHRLGIGTRNPFAERRALVDEPPTGIENMFAHAGFAAVEDEDSRQIIDGRTRGDHDATSSRFGMKTARPVSSGMRSGLFLAHCAASGFKQSCGENECQTSIS